MLSIISKRERREAVIRSSLIDHLKESVQSLLQGPGGQGIPRLSANVPKGPILGHSDNTNLLCCIVEAILIHGLKDSLGEKLSSMFLGDIDRMPIPNFWPVIMLISHRDLKEQVSSLSFIVSDVGKGRAWMRLALNQGQLLSYLSVLASETNILKDYYKPSAFLRDLENCDIMLRVMQPISAISFKLATNAAILNTWTQTPLILSGVWIPSNYEQSSLEPILSATDVASTFHDASCEEVGVAIPQTPISDQMFDLILGGTPETEFINGCNNVNASPLQEKVRGKNEASLNTSSFDDDNISESCSESHICDASSLENSNSNTAIDSENIKSYCTSKELECTTIPIQKGLNRNISCTLSPSEQNSEKTCSALLSPISVSSEILSHSISCDPDNNGYKSLFTDWEESDDVENLPPFLKLYSSYGNNQQSLNHSPETPSEEENSEFEILPSAIPFEQEISIHFPTLTRLQKEEGLDKQNYQCHGTNCGVPIGLTHGKPRLCYFDGKHYCYECHHGEMWLIPSRMIHNWDFTRYAVSKANKILLESVYMHPFINIRLLNPEIYKYVEQMADLQSLRRQLHFIQAYLFTCKTSNKGQELRKLLWPREHLYEHVHLYSIYDLEQADNGKLARLLKQADHLGRSHILKCQTCSPRGFICEVCKKDQIIYPFELGHTFTCGRCSGVYHNVCITEPSDCPKCKRIKMRREALKEEES